MLKWHVNAWFNVRERKHWGLYVFKTSGMDTVGTDLPRIMAKSGPHRANKLRLSRVITVVLVGSASQV